MAVIMPYKGEWLIAHPKETGGWFTRRFPTNDQAVDYAVDRWGSVVPATYDQIRFIRRTYG